MKKLEVLVRFKCDFLIITLNHLHWDLLAPLERILLTPFSGLDVIWDAGGADGLLWVRS